jgi:hypothetical protein
MVNAVGLPTSTFATRLLPGLKCEVMPHYAKASLQLLIQFHSFNGSTQFAESLEPFVTVNCCFYARNSYSRRPSQSQNVVAIISFEEGSNLNYFCSW